MDELCAAEPVHKVVPESWCYFFYMGLVGVLLVKVCLGLKEQDILSQAPDLYSPFEGEKIEIRSTS